MARLELPGIGDIAISGTDIVHCTPTSLTAYGITEPTTLAPTPSPQPRSVSSLIPTPMLRTLPDLKKHRSHALLREAPESNPKTGPIGWGIGAGQEIERDGGGGWSKIGITGSRGYGVGQDAIEVGLDTSKLTRHSISMRDHSESAVAIHTMAVCAMFGWTIW